MSERTQDRLFAACGIASVVLLLVGSLVGSAGGQPSYTLSSSSAQIAHALASGRRTLGWSGIAIALLTLVATPALLEHGGQAGYFLWLGWIVYASFSLGRGALAPEAAAVATSRGYVPSAR